MNEFRVSWYPKGSLTIKHVVETNRLRAEWLYAQASRMGLRPTLEGRVSNPWTLIWGEQQDEETEK